jgi:hypothetical protein
MYLAIIHLGLKHLIIRRFASISETDADAKFLRTSPASWNCAKKVVAAVMRFPNALIRWRLYFNER